MISALARLPAPSAPPSNAWLARLRAVATRVAGGRSGATAVAAVYLGPRPLAVRVQRPSGDSGALTLRVVPAEGLDLDTAPTAWKRAGIFKAATPLLVLRTAERQLLTIDQPQVPDTELPLAVRWPLAEAMECEAEALLATAVALPRINDAQRTQVLAVGARLEPVRQQVSLLRAHGISVRSIDVIDSALRGMALLARRAGGPTAPAGAVAAAPGMEHAQVVLASVGNDLCIGLLQAGRFCAVRTLALPAAPPRDAAAFEEQLALHLQRTTDSFERQATRLAVREVLAWLPSIEPAAREDVRRMLPLSARWFVPAEAFAMDVATAALVAADDELAALACVAATRLLEPSPLSAEATAPGAAEAQP